MDISDIILERCPESSYERLFSRWYSLGHRNEFFPNNAHAHIVDPLTFDDPEELIHEACESDLRPRLSVRCAGYQKFYPNEFNPDYLDDEIANVMFHVNKTDHPMGHIELRLRGEHGENTTLVFSDCHDVLICHYLRIHQAHFDLVQWQGDKSENKFVSALYDPWGF